MIHDAGRGGDAGEERDPHQIQQCTKQLQQTSAASAHLPHPVAGNAL